MRKVTYGAACSLDGFITARDGGMDWLHFSQDVQEVMASYWQNVDTILMGRRTWAGAVASQEAGTSEEGTADPAGGIRTYVFSRTLKAVSQPGVQLVTDAAGEFVRALKQREGGEICLMGGGDLARSLFEAGVIDEVGLNIHPVLLGSGTPLFGDPGRRIGLQLLENRTIDGGCLLATYRVTG